MCWGFSVLITWAASEANLNGGWPLWGTWGATLLWTFGFDTIYAMSDRNDDQRLGIQSSALNLGKNVLLTVSLSYAFTSILIAISSFNAGVSYIFWSLWLIVTIGMQREVWKLKVHTSQASKYVNHFKNQVWLGSLLFLGLIIGRIN